MYSLAQAVTPHTLMRGVFYGAGHWSGEGLPTFNSRGFDSLRLHPHLPPVQMEAGINGDCWFGSRPSPADLCLFSSHVPKQRCRLIVVQGLAKLPRDRNIQSLGTLNSVVKVTLSDTHSDIIWFCTRIEYKCQVLGVLSPNKECAPLLTFLIWGR